MFSGSLVAIVTPMHSDGAVDYTALRRLVEWQLASKTSGIVILGTTGEAPTVEPEERHKIISQTVAQVKEAVPVIVGTGANSTLHSIQLTREAMQLGADAALLVTPYYNRPSQEGLYQHFRAIAQAVPLPQILYNVPSRTACDLLPATVGRLAEFLNIVAVKEATGDMQRLRDLLALNTSMDMLTGNDDSALEFMLQGGRGVISVVANVAPYEMHQLCAAVAKGDHDSAKRINDQLAALQKALFAEANPIPTKWLLAEMGLIDKGIRLPLTPLNSQYHDVVRNAMQVARVDYPIFKEV